MYPKNVLVGILAAGCFVTASVVAPNVGQAQSDPRVTKSMETFGVRMCLHRMRPRPAMITVS